MYAATEKKKEADQAAAQKASTDAANSRAEKSKRSRAAFAAKFGAAELDKMAPLYANPFALEGKAILVRGRFVTMEVRSTALFSAFAYGMSDHAGEIIVGDFPATAFVEHSDTLLAVRVVGQRKVEGSLIDKAPHVKYIGHIKCPPSNERFPLCP